MVWRKKVERGVLDALMNASGRRVPPLNLIRANPW
jgi:hypothetical protein